jgi:hypothetical protein
MPETEANMVNWDEAFEEAAAETAKGKLPPVSTERLKALAEKKAREDAGDPAIVQTEPDEEEAAE